MTTTFVWRYRYKICKTEKITPHLYAHNKGPLFLSKEQTIFPMSSWSACIRESVAPLVKATDQEFVSVAEPDFISVAESDFFDNWKM
jgi:hypothetical protein